MSISEQLVTIADKVAAIESDVRYAVTTAHSKGYNVLPNGGLPEITKLVDSLPMANSEPISSSYKDTFLWQHFTNGKIISEADAIGSISPVSKNRNSLAWNITCGDAVAIAVWLQKGTIGIDFYNAPMPAPTHSHSWLLPTRQNAVITLPENTEIYKINAIFGSVEPEKNYNTNFTLSVALIASDGTVTFLGHNTLCTTDTANTVLL